MSVIAFTFTHPITNTLGGYTYQALTADATATTHTLLTNPTTHYQVGDYSILPNNPNTWIPYSSTITKTIYDPCPYGYRVPINGSWTGFTVNKTWTINAITGGASWPTENGGWWPAAGYRYRGSAMLDRIGCDGYYWSSSLSSSYAHAAHYLYFHYSNGASPSNAHYRSYCLSVRCIEE